MMPDPSGTRFKVPTPEEIAEACRELQDGWTEHEEASHRNWQVRIGDDGMPGIVRGKQDEGIQY